MKIMPYYNKPFYLIFILTFAIVFSSLTFYNIPSSANGVEQWVNLTNQMFYGSQDFMFSYGPLYWMIGMASSMYSKTSYIIAKCFLSFEYALFWSIVGILINQYKKYFWFVALYMLFFRSLSMFAILYMLPLLLIYYFEYSQDSLKLNFKGSLLLGSYIGFTFYLRFCYGMLGIITICTYLFSIFVLTKFAKRDFLNLVGVILSVCISYIIVGLGVFHKSSHVFNYFIINMQLNFGNSVDMTFNVSNSAMCFIAILICLVSFNIFTIRYNHRLFLTINALFCILFKMGFSRADHYIQYFVIPMVIVSFLFLFKKTKLTNSLMITFLLAISYITVYPSSSTWLYNRMFNLGIDYQQNYKDRMSDTYKMFKLSDQIIKQIGDNSIDVYPYNNEYMFANNLNYKYRTSFQNYMTLTPKLDAMNQMFFESLDKPDFILWTAGISCTSPKTCNVFDGFDDKNSLNEDPLTSSAIMLNYHLISLSTGKNNTPIALLKKNTETVKYHFKVLKHQDMRFGVWYPVPEETNGVIKLIPDFKFSAYGKLKNLLFRGELLYIDYKLADEEILHYRLNILNSNSGVWVSPFIKDFTFKGKKVKSIMLRTSSDKYFVSHFKADWINVPIAAVK